MKSSHKAIAILFIAGCVMNGCTQDKLPTAPYIPNPPPPPAGSGVLTANIDGLPWVARDGAGIPSGTSTYNGNLLHISGSQAVVGDTADVETIDLVIDLSASKAYIVPGTYALGSIPAQAGEAQHNDGMICICHTNSAHSGTLTITALDVARKVVSGRFAFNGIGATGQTHIISEGMFDVTWK
jgi:hypothetical protein